jgi:transposase-like protein
MFIPPHCSNKDCKNFYNPESKDWYKFFAYYRTKAFGQVPRFVCRSCKKTFSSQTFSINYYAKHPIDYELIFKSLNSASGIRNISRDLYVHNRQIINRMIRLSRNIMIISQMLSETLPFQEDFAADGFESFIKSQYFPDNYNILVGKDSLYLYQIDYSHLRRKGRMTKAQKKTRARLEKIYKAAPDEIMKSFIDIFLYVARHTNRRESVVNIGTDEKKDYIRAIRKCDLVNRLIREGKWNHVRINSREPRTGSNPLYPVNYMDREFRKDIAMFVRESVKFGRNVNNAMRRINIYAFWHNFLKEYRINDNREKFPTHFEMAGGDGKLAAELIEGVFTKRYFWREKRPPGKPVLKTIRDEWVTPLEKPKTRKLAAHLMAC